MSIPEQHGPVPGGFPGNELEEVLAAAVGVPGAGARIVEVLARSHLWVPLPQGGGPDSPSLDLPTVDIDGVAYVPVFSSEEQFRQVAGAGMAYAVAPAVEFARGLPPQLGIAVNPGGAVGVPLPAPAVADLCRAADPLVPVAPGPDGLPAGGRVRLFEPDWQEEPVDFLAAAGLEFARVPGVRTARRALASVEGAPPALFVGVQSDTPGPESQAAALDALGRALGAVPVPWPVQLVLLDVTRDPVADWMLERVRPFYDRDL
ncbi:enhanced serine sensitivity protein SseB [Streptomyces sp. B1866]|uniref:enhanced serine sensitivity protein SseB n=1 Tax=Streptomyces sp. B1866 TaxID=3075431 RepID=UPI00288F4832|nr:enhanced serine sensitivity protein SseB [Streptomyces sp. B1866]MDT3400534.1 enhanced serine sensitivity protein SseB [Streptomyces sp. B1866]